MEAVERAMLERLYRAYGGTVFAHCRRLLGDRAAAEDAAHETFLRVRRYVTSTTTPAELLPLIYRIATNFCLKQIRDRKARARLHQLFSTTESDVEHPLLDGLHALHSLRQLPEQTQRIAWLTYAGMTQSEVAESLSISRRTVVYRLSELRSAQRRREARPPLSASAAE